VTSVIEILVWFRLYAVIDKVLAILSVTLFALELLLSTIQFAIAIRVLFT